MDIGKVEYRVRPVTRYVVTRYTADTEGRPIGSEVRGEYDGEHLAYEVGYALAKDEHRRRGWPVGDERIQYPVSPKMSPAPADANAA